MNRKLLKEGISKDVMLVFYVMNKKCRKIVLTMMALLMIVVSVLPSNYQVVYGEEQQEPVYSNIESNKKISQYDTTTDAEFDIKNIEITEEVDKFRTINSKTFKKVDGTYELVIYGTPIHYIDNEKYKEIDNSLLLNSDKDEYKNKANSFDVYFPKTLDNNKSIKLSKDEYSVEWSLNGITKKSEIAHVDAEKTKNNIKEVMNSNDSVTYYNVFNNIDLEYIVSGNKIKENIILNDFLDNYEIEFTYETKELELKQNNNGDYVFLNSLGDVVFSLEKLYMIDSKGEISFDIDI